MELDARNQSISEVRARNMILTYALLASSVVVLVLAIKVFTQSSIVILQTPGMPNDAVIEKTAMDKRAQIAVLQAVTNAMASVNPANAQYQKQFVQAFLAPGAYTKISKEIDARVAKQITERELGSTYFVLNRYEFDEKLNKHFVLGDFHSVNAAKDTAQQFIWEYDAHIENYRFVVDKVTLYPGDRPHNTEWIEASKK